MTAIPSAPQHEEPEASRKRTALLALLLTVPAPSIGTAAAMFWWPELPVGKAIFIAAKVWLVLLPLIWRLAVDREPLSWSPPEKGGFGVAVASGFLIALAILGGYLLTVRFGILNAELISRRAAKTGLDQFGFYLGAAIYWITLNSLIEEYVWRWFVFRKSEILLGGRGGVVVAALAFTAHHVVALAAQFNWGITLIASAGVFVGGAVWNILYLKYRSIWPGYVSHAIADVAIFVIGYRLIFTS